MEEESPTTNIIIKRRLQPKWIALVVAWVLVLGALAFTSWQAYFKEKEKTQTLAEQIHLACKSRDFGPGFSLVDEEKLCGNAEKIIEENKLDNKETNDPEIQEPEIQNPEIQEPEIQEPEIQDPEKQQDESQDEETQDPEIQEPEIQNSEIQDEETQDPEIDDPDPASPFNFTFTIPGNNPNDPGITYTCNSGTGQCTRNQ